MAVQVSDFDFDLPPELIAQQPPAERGTSRLLRLDRRSGALSHHSVGDLPHLLRAGDLLVVNNTRVFPARLLGKRDPSGGNVECLLVTRVEAADSSGVEVWEALVHPGQKLKPGSRVVSTVRRRFTAILSAGSSDGAASACGPRTARSWKAPWTQLVIRCCPTSGAQTARVIGSAIKRCCPVARFDAAPTGLHFTPALLDAIAVCGVERAEVTLHVGYGTFQPIRVNEVEEHRMEAEQFEIADAAAASINAALDEGRRVIAVGTTTTRTLESVARANGGRIVPGRGATELFIYPGFDFRVLIGLVTTSLAAVVAAHVGARLAGSSTC